MIQTDKLLFVENPRTGSTAIGDTLLANCDVSPITPRHGSLRDNIFEGGEVKPSEIKVLSFTVVRNPYDRMVSLWRMDHNKLPFFVWFKARVLEWQFLPQHYYTEGVKLILKYEDLHKEFNALVKSVGYDFTLPSYKPHERDLLSPKDMKLVEKEYAKDFKLFGYPLESSKKGKSAV